MIAKILKMGHPLLLEKSVPITQEEFGSRILIQLIEDLTATKNHLGGVGIAAPQIGVSKQVIVIEYYEKNITRYQNVGNQAKTIIINPQYQVLDDEQTEFAEGCLSLPGLRGTVQRSKSIAYSYYDEYGNKHNGTSSSFFARVFQHEYDHLQGILYPMRMNNIASLHYVDNDLSI